VAVHLRLGPGELLGLRFARSPLAETVGALRTLREPRRHAVHLPWLRSVDRDAVAGASALLAPLTPARGACPAFLTPVPPGPCTPIDDELDSVAATLPEVVRADLLWCAAHPLTRPEVRAALRAMAADPGPTLRAVVAAQRTCWRHLVAPYWTRIDDLLGADIAHRTARLGADGVGAVLGSLHGDLTWEPDVLTVHRGHDGDHDLRGRGLVLMPAVFGWPMTIALTERQPVLVYPARGVGTLDPPPRERGRGAALGALVGRSRARLLVLLDDEASGATLARRAGLGAPATSVHLAVLREAGLVTSRREGREVRYRRTALGRSLLDG
jgi:DNA-binding transcriptional ArsR family regulator